MIKNIMLNYTLHNKLIVTSVNKLKLLNLVIPIVIHLFEVSYDLEVFAYVLLNQHIWNIIEVKHGNLKKYQ
jgi:hypothetical protein